jgi:hypothetical protein
MRSIRELLLGLRMSLAGGRSGWVRAGLTALGVGLGVALLLVAVSVPAAMQARNARQAAQDDVLSLPTPPPKSDTTILIAYADTEYHGVAIRGRFLQPDGAHPPVPPGLSALPAPGQMVVSPALARLLASPDGALLRERLNYPIVGTVGKAGLSGPADLDFYVGSDTLQADTGPVVRLAAFGSTAPAEGLDPILKVIAVLIVVALLVPVGMFVAAAIRFGSEARDRRLAGVRLLGADARMARRIAAGEALGSSLAGLVVGAAFFLIGRSLVDKIQLFGLSAFPSDIRPDPVLTVLLVGAVPAASVAVTLFSLRRVVIEPLGVARRAGDSRRRLWWRLLPPLAGVAVLLPMRGPAARGAGQVNTTQVATGMILILVGIAALLPWLVQAAVRRIRGGPVAWQLAVRRLQLDSSTSARAVMGIAVAVAGAIGLQTVFASAEARYVAHTHADPSRADAMTTLGIDGGWSAVLATDSRVLATPGVETVHSRLEIQATFPPRPGSPEAVNDKLVTTVTVADCATLADMALLDSCTDGDVFLLPPSEATNYGPVPEKGSVVTFDAWPGETTPPSGTWTVPATARAASPRVDPLGVRAAGVLATPAAVPDALLAARTRTTTSYVHLSHADPDAVERLRNAVWRIDPADLPSVSAVTLTVTADRFASMRTALFAGATVTLVLIGVSLLVTVLEQLRERRRVLAGLVAFGTRPSTLAWSILWQTAVPVALGMALAVGAGLAVGSILLKIVNSPITIAWGDVGLFAGVAAVVVLLVTAASTPALWRLMRAEGLHTE